MMTDFIIFRLHVLPCDCRFLRECANLLVVLFASENASGGASNRTMTGRSLLELYILLAKMLSLLSVLTLPGNICSKGYRRTAKIAHRVVRSATCCREAVEELPVKIIQ